jgi:hypothetical protein
MEDTVWAGEPVLVTNVSMSTGSKPMASNSISPALSNHAAAGASVDYTHRGVRHASCAALAGRERVDCSEVASAADATDS